MICGSFPKEILNFIKIKNDVTEQKYENMLNKNIRNLTSVNMRLSILNILFYNFSTIFQINFIRINDFSYIRLFFNHLIFNEMRLINIISINITKENYCNIAANITLVNYC